MQKFTKKLLVILESTVLKYLTVAVLISVPLYPKFPLFRVPGTYVSVRLEDFLILTVALLLFVLTLPNLRKILQEKIILSILVFIFVSLVSLLSAVYVSQTVELHIGLFHLLRRIEYFLLFFLGIMVIRKNLNLNFFINILYIVTILVFLYGVGQKYWDFPVVTTQNLEFSKGVALHYMPGSHLNSTFAGHYDLATFLVLTLPIFFARLAVERKLLSKASSLIVITMGLWLLVGTISRISIASYFLSVGLTLFVLRKYKWIPIFALISLIVFSNSSDLVSRYSRIFMITVKRIVIVNPLSSTTIFAQDVEVLAPSRRNTSTPEPTEIPVFEDRSTSIRLNVEWPRAIRALKKNPLLGTGFSSITLATDNDYLRLLGEVGVIGCVAFLTIILSLVVSIVKKVLPVKKDVTLETAFVVSVLCSLVGILINAIFIDVFEASKFAIIFWLLAGMAYATVNYENYTKNDK